ncbi:hypothetical protein [Xanthocytophaga agilis]|uniref:Uncharacterized protein n=1 Tax=Xanthocytophaga agilis TaxID=3048010 RepID=A0AAE3R909_9BACT|nr:hypothetical protein [Xanthocytophaga agilis]MDJ1503679.1 hypothetical protein [Xanthocytophaga agilis]
MPKLINSAEFINRLGKGYLPDGRRHPHAFPYLIQMSLSNGL